MRRELVARTWASVAPGTLATYASAMRCWNRFCHLTHARPLPASAEAVGLFACIFRNADTAKTYLAGVAKMHAAAGHVMPKHPAVPAILRRLAQSAPTRRPRPWLTPKQVTAACAAVRREGTPRAADAIAVAWGFLLRVPSELLPLRACQVTKQRRDRSVLLGPLVLSLIHI